MAKDLKNELMKGLHDTNFFSIEMDSSIDSSNIKQEIFMATYCDPYGDDRVEVRFFHRL